jgi:hypothetical protein
MSQFSVTKRNPPKPRRRSLVPAPGNRGDTDCYCKIEKFRIGYLKNQ